MLLKIYGYTIFANLWRKDEEITCKDEEIDQFY